MVLSPDIIIRESSQVKWANPAFWAPDFQTLSASNTGSASLSVP